MKKLFILLIIIIQPILSMGCDKNKKKLTKKERNTFFSSTQPTYVPPEVQSNIALFMVKDFIEHMYKQGITFAIPYEHMQGGDIFFYKDEYQWFSTTNDKEIYRCDFTRRYLNWRRESFSRGASCCYCIDYGFEIYNHEKVALIVVKILNKKRAHKIFSWMKYNMSIEQAILINIIFQKSKLNMTHNVLVFDKKFQQKLSDIKTISLQNPDPIPLSTQDIYAWSQIPKEIQKLLKKYLRFNLILDKDELVQVQKCCKKYCQKCCLQCVIL